MQTHFFRFGAFAIASVTLSAAALGCSPIEAHQASATATADVSPPTPEPILEQTPEAPTDWPVYSLAAELPDSPAQLRLYRQEHPARPPKRDELTPLLAQLRASGTISTSTDEGGNPVTSIQGEQAHVRIWSIDPLSFVLETGVGVPTNDEPQMIVPPEKRAGIAEAFLKERGLLGFPYRLEPPTLSRVSHQTIRVVPLIDGYPLNDYNSLNGRLMVLFKGADVSYVFWRPLKLIAGDMAGVTPAAQAWDQLVSGRTPAIDGDGQCWQALVFDPYDPSAVALPISDKRCVSYSGSPIRFYEAATIEWVELVYFARDLSLGASPYAFPADSPVRLVFPMWQFRGVTNDGRPLEVLWPALLPPPPETPPVRTGG